MYIAMDAAAATELLFALMAGGEIIAGMVKTTKFIPFYSLQFLREYQNIAAVGTL